MPVPSSITDLSTTAGSNSPSGSESPITADDYLRTISAFVATLRDGKGQSAEATVASASTADIGAASSPFVQITGTTGITSFGTTYSGARYVRFSGALTITHNATTLILPAGTNITTAAGDTLVAVPTGNPGAGWRVVVYQRADGSLLVGSYVAKAGDTMTGTLTLPTLKASSSAGLIFQNASGTQVADFGPGPGTGITFVGQVNASAFAGSGANLTGFKKIAQRVFTQNGSLGTGTATMSWADTIPQNTAGTQFLSQSFTPTNASSTLVIEALLQLSPNADNRVIAALFQSGSANAIAAAGHYMQTANGHVGVYLRAEMTAGGTSAITFTARAGMGSAGTITFNGASAGRIFGGVNCSFIAITEFLP